MHTKGPVNSQIPSRVAVTYQETFRQIPIQRGLRPKVRGKFLFVGEQKFYIRGVTYGTFRPDAEGNEFPPSETVESDFLLMAASGINAVRTYTVPPGWLLDAAERHGLRVMVGLPVERSAGFLCFPHWAR